MTSLAGAPRPALPAAAARLLPGLALAGAVTGAAFALHALPGLGFLSPMILAVLAGGAVGAVLGRPEAVRPGLRFAVRRLLRAGVVLVGLQVAPAEIVALGAPAVAAVLGALALTFVVTRRLGAALGVKPGLALLIAAGTSVCGASAVLAAEAADPQDEADVAYAIACVTLFGTAAMVIAPLLGGLLDLSPRLYGLWTGAAIHEVAQVAAAAFQRGAEAGHVAVVAKLTRVAALVPLVAAIGWGARRRAPAAAAAAGRRAPMPLFLLGFLALAAVNGALPVPPALAHGAAAAASLLLTAALAAMGLDVDLRRLAGYGWRPLALAAAASVTIAALAFGLVSLAG